VSDEAHLRAAIERGREGMEQGSGGPFGALIVRDGRVLAATCNEVLLLADPTAHAEIQCIRAACAKVGDFRLHGATIYSSCEPCPMCLAAIHWARIERVVFAASREDAAAIGFDDEMLYREFAGPPAQRTLRSTQGLRDEARAMMLRWTQLDHRVDY